MSICTIPQVLSRISVASIDSPIAVFNSNESFTFRVFFADTLLTRGMIKNAEENGLIGIFDKTMNPKHINTLLQEKVKQ